MTHEEGSAPERVAAFFDRLLERDPTGASWLGPLLVLPPGATALEVCDPGPLQEHAWWPEGRTLDAPPSLLSWLVRNLRCPSSIEACGPTPAVPAHLTDGPASPDVYLATAEVVVVIDVAAVEEGASGEAVSRDACRRLLRDLDAALAPAGPRSLVGLLLVEGEPDGDLPDEWRNACSAAGADEALAEVLPHRTPEERAYLARCLLGAASWQAAVAAVAPVAPVADAGSAAGAESRHTGGVG